MKRGQAGWRGARTALSLVVATSMALAGWSVPALEALADEAEVIAEEAPVSNEQPVQSGATTEEALAVQDDGEDPFVPGGMTANQELIFIDGTATLSVHLDKIGAPEGTQPELKAGRFYPGGVGNNGLQWGDDLGIEGLLRYDEESSTVIVDGTKLADTDLVSNRNVGVYINADFTWGESDSQTTKVGSVVLFVDEPFVGHDQENERVMLRGWDGDVDNEYNVYVENAAFPNGEDLRYTVTNVEIESSEPNEPGDVVLAITQKEDGQGWHYEARNFGHAVVRVSYRDPAELGGGTGSYTFDVHVDDVVYDLNLRTSTGSDRLLPGKSVDFEVTGRRKWENPETGERGEDSDGLSYSWDVVSTRGDLGNVPENVASIDQNGRLTALALPDDVHGVWQFVNVRVTMKDAHDPNANTTCDFELKICDNYTEVWPPAINSRLIPGKSQTITPEVRNYRVDLANDYEVIPNVTFEASGVDQNAVTVEKNGDGSFTITRLDRYPTDFFITGRWADDEHDDLEKPCRYHLDHIDFGMSFKNGDQERLYPGDSVTLEPEAAEADRDLFDSCELDWSVGVANDRGEFSYDNATSDDEKVFSVVGNTIVLDANKCLANETIREHGGINVCARAKVGGVELADAWCWVELREPHIDYDRENDRNMLPGWGDDIDREYNVYVENAAFPNGEDLRYTVTNVEVESSEPNEPGDVVLAITQKDDGQGWHYEARNFGHAVVRVTYRDPAKLGGGTGSYAFEVHVGNTVHEVDMWSEDGVYRALPGQTITVYAQGVRKQQDEEDKHDGFGYEWSLGDNAQYATLTVDQSDPQRAYVT
ncbi:MAG: hypothetical protein IKG22_10200, partial [Atopobiaceae bacterium]|nr:hypothetical protein [Atopobiaceae bacterium]